MAPSNFILSPADPSDIHQMVSVNQRAFKNDYFNRHTIAPATISPEIHTAWLTDRYLTAFTKPECKIMKVTDTTTGNLAAWGRWTRPYRFSAEEKAAKVKEEEKRKAAGRSLWPEGALEEACDAKFGALDKLKEKYVDAEQDWVMSLLQVDPEYQKKGLARMILQEGLDVVDAEGRKCFIESTADGYPVYLKLGFRDLEILEVDLRRWGGEEMGINRFMVRDPQSAT